MSSDKNHPSTCILLVLTRYHYVLHIGRAGGLVKSIGELGDSIVPAIWLLEIAVCRNLVIISGSLHGLAVPHGIR